MTKKKKYDFGSLLISILLLCVIVIIFIAIKTISDINKVRSDIDKTVEKISSYDTDYDIRVPPTKPDDKYFVINESDWESCRKFGDGWKPVKMVDGLSNIPETVCENASKNIKYPKGSWDKTFQWNENVVVNFSVNGRVYYPVFNNDRTKVCINQECVKI